MLVAAEAVLRPWEPELVVILDRAAQVGSATAACGASSADAVGSGRAAGCLQSSGLVVVHDRSCCAGGAWQAHVVAGDVEGARDLYRRAHLIACRVGM